MRHSANAPVPARGVGDCSRLASTAGAHPARIPTLPQELLESITRNKVALKGPLTTPVGGGFTSVNVGLRKALELFANLRPVWNIPGVPSRYENVDLVMAPGFEATAEWQVIPAVRLRGGYLFTHPTIEEAVDPTLEGKLLVTGGLGGMGGAQPLAATMNSALCLGIEVDPIYWGMAIEALPRLAALPINGIESDDETCEKSLGTLS